MEKEIQVAAEKAGKKAPKLLSCVMDVVDREAIERAAKEVERSFGRLDVLVNNAGYLETFLPIAESDPDEWWKTWTVVSPYTSLTPDLRYCPPRILTKAYSHQNVRGPYLTTRAFLPLLLQAGDKTIINLSSFGAHTTRQGGSGYQTGKLAITRFTEFIMSEYGEQGVLAWSVHPGGVMTELASKLPKHMHGSEFLHTPPSN